MLRLSREPRVTLKEGRTRNLEEETSKLLALPLEASTTSEYQQRSNMDLDIAQRVALLVSSGSAAGFAGLAGAQRLGYLLGKNGNGNSKEMTKVTMTLESMLRVLEPLAGILNGVRIQLGVIAEKQTAVAKIPVMDEKIQGIKEALLRIEEEIKDLRK